MEWMLHEIYIRRHCDVSITDRMTRWEETKNRRFYIETFCIMCVSYFLAIYLTGLAKIFALFGALGGYVAFVALYSLNEYLMAHFPLARLLSTYFPPFII
jgi:hypothetical protein